MVIIFITGTLSISNAQNDSLISKTQWYRSSTFKTVALPAIFIGYGLSVSGNNGLFLSSAKLHTDVMNAFPGFHTGIDNYLAFSPAALALGLKMGGVKTKHDYINGFMLYAVSASITMGLTYGLKYTVKEERPDHSDNQSFPSAHTSFSFQGAEFLHQEYIDQSPWYSVAGYTLAAATGGLRVLNDKHWLNDVCVGAGIGIITTRLVYIVYPAILNKIKARKRTGMSFHNMQSD